MARLGRPFAETNDELEMPAASALLRIFVAFGEKPSHHQTPTSFEPAIDLNTEHTFAAYFAWPLNETSTPGSFDLVASSTCEVNARELFG